MASMKLIVGLGNPEQKHAFNRHNVGFMTVDAIAAAHGFADWRKRFEGHVAEGKPGQEQVLLLKPQTFMNASGRSVGEAMRFYKLKPGNVVVFHDEFDLAPGKIRVKTGGGLAVHTALLSSIRVAGCAVVRVRIGIGPPGRADRVTGFALHNFAKLHSSLLEPLLGAIAAEAPLLAEGATEEFQSRVAHAMQQA